MGTAVTFALFFGCSLAFLYTQWKFGPRMSWLRSGLLFVMAAGLLWLGAGAPSPLSVRLKSLASAPSPREDALVVGNHHDYADLIVTPYASDNGIKPATPAHDTYVTVSTVTGKVDIRSAPGDIATGTPAMISAWQQGKDKLVIAGAVPLSDAADICLDRACSAPLHFKASAWKSILLPGGTVGEGLPAGHPPYYHQRVFRPAGLAAKRSAIIHGTDGKWYLLALDPEVSVKGATAPETAPRLDPRHHFTVSLFRLDMPDLQFAAPPRLALRSTFRLTQDGTSAVLTPGKPMIRPAGTCDQPRLTLTRLSHTARTAVYGTPAPTLIFPALGNGSLTKAGAARSYSPMNRAHDGPLLGKDHALCGYQLRYLSADGQGMEITRGGNALTFQVSAMHMPWPILLLFMPAALVLIHFANRNWWRENRQDYILMGLLQYLLTVRILIGVRGGYMDWQLLSSDIFSDVTAAFIALPVALTGLRPLASLGWKPRAVMLGAALALLVLVWMWAPSLNASLGISAVLAVAGLAWPVVPIVTSKLLRKLQSPVLSAWWRTHANTLATALIVALAVVLMRWIASAFGVRERVFGIAVSLLYLAVLLPCFAVGLAAISRSPKKTLAQAIAFSLTLFVAIVLIPALVRDNGFALIYPLPILAVAVTEAWKWQAGDVKEKAVQAAWRLAPPVAVVLGLAWVGLYPYLGKLPPQDLTGIDGIAYALKFQSSNEVRLLSLFHSDLVSGFGTRNAAANAQFWLDLHTFTRSAFGTGYVSDQSLGAFGYQALHFSDNLSAVHLMHPFGKLGAIAFLAVIFGSLAKLERLPQPDPTGRVLARLCLWAILIIAAYMILANLGWVPFTGRNIYLLAVTSGSDLAEGFMLLAMATVALRMGRAT